MWNNLLATKNQRLQKAAVQWRSVSSTLVTPNSTA
jgi:hypothetical protein